MFCIETLGLGIHVCVMGNLRYCIVLLHLCYYKINQHTFVQASKKVTVYSLMAMMLCYGL